MRSKTSALLAIVGLVAGAVSFLAGPSTAHAGTITCVQVVNGGLGNFVGNFGAAAGTCPASNTWTNGGAPIVIPEGGTLVLTQNQANATGLAGFNFDTTDQGTGPGAQYVVTINGVALLDTARVLDFGGNDNNSVNTNEAHNWALISPLAGIPCGAGHICDVWVGYADTLHGSSENPGGVCPDTDHNCLPNTVGGAGIPAGIWQGTANIFLGNGSSLLPGFPGQGPTCTATSANCFDAGAILISERRVSTPEPSSLFLLGVGLMGVAAYGRRQLRKNS